MLLEMTYALIGILEKLWKLLKASELLTSCANGY